MKAPVLIVGAAMFLAACAPATTPAPIRFVAETVVVPTLAPTPVATAQTRTPGPSTSTATRLWIVEITPGPRPTPTGAPEGFDEIRQGDWRVLVPRTRMTNLGIIQPEDLTFGGMIEAQKNDPIDVDRELGMDNPFVLPGPRYVGTAAGSAFVDFTRRIVIVYPPVGQGTWSVAPSGDGVTIAVTTTEGETNRVLIMTVTADGQLKAWTRVFGPTQEEKEEIK